MGGQVAHGRPSWSAAPPRGAFPVLKCLIETCLAAVRMPHGLSEARGEGHHVCVGGVHLVEAPGTSASPLPRASEPAAAASPCPRESCREEGRVKAPAGRPATPPSLGRLCPADGRCRAPTSRRHSGFTDCKMRSPPGQSEAPARTWRRATLPAGAIDPDADGEAELRYPVETRRTPSGLQRVLQGTSQHRYARQEWSMGNYTGPSNEG